MNGQTIERIAEAGLRVGLGLRFLTSGVSNVRRWPHATETAAIISAERAYPLGAIATALMVLGGAGLVSGLATRLAALLLFVFLVPTFAVHRYWLRVLPADAEAIAATMTNEAASEKFRLLRQHAVHSHDTGLRENAVYLLACLYFVARGSSGFSMDTALRR